MKNLIQTFCAIILTCVWAVPPQAHAIPTSIGTYKVLRAAFTVSKTQFGISLVDEAGAPISTFVTKPSASLVSVMPSKIGHELKEATKFGLVNMAREKLMRFPVESLGFFISLGALVTYDMMMKSASNPVGMEQLIQSQLDPVGQVAFYAFMLANGAAAEPFMAMIQNGRLNPRLAPFLSYGGMGVGMIASNIVHEVGHWPGLAQCAKDMWSVATNKTQDTNYKNCDKAQSAWVEKGGFGGISNEWTPGLISLVGSTILAGALQGAGKLILTGLGKGVVAVAAYAGRWTLGRTIQFAAVELAFALVPGGLAMKSVRLAGAGLGFIAQLTVFNGVQHWFEEKVMPIYQNFAQSGDLKHLDSSLLTDLLRAKEQSWDETSSAMLAADLGKFSKAMKTWRQMNMAEVLQTQSNWEQKLGQLTMMYSASQMFYSDFLNRMWQRQYGPYKASYASGAEVSIVDRTFPLNGVIVAPAEGKDETTWLEAPDMIEDRQIVTIQNALKTFKAPQLSAGETAKLNALISGLQKPDKKEIGKALDQLNCQLALSTDPACIIEGKSPSFAQALMTLRKSLGNPRPIWQAGLGYIVAYNNTPANQLVDEKTLYPKSFGVIATPTLPEAMIASMFYGPNVEKGESTVKFNNGFKDEFKPPRLRSEDKWQVSIQMKSTSDIPNIFNTNIYSYFNKGNVNSKVFGPDAESFNKWWKQYPETHYVNAWLDYEKIYQKNIALLIEKLYENENSASRANRGPISNGIMNSMLQEARFYTMVLGEIMKDSFYIAAKKSPEEAFSPEKRYFDTNKEGIDLQLLSYLKKNSILDFATYMKAQKMTVPMTLDFGKSRNLAWQNQLLSKFEEVQSLFGKLQARDIQITGGTVEKMPVSTLEGKELQAKVDEFNALLEDMKKTVFPDEILLNQYQKAAVTASFKGLSDILVEMKGLAEAANAASYVERHNEQGHASRRCVNAPNQGLSSVKAVQRVAEGC